MTTGIDLGFALMRDLMLDTWVFNVGWVFSVLATFFTLLALTRDTEKWKNLAFPVMIGWHIAGIPPFFLLYIVSGLMFVVENLSLQTIGSLATIMRREPKEKTQLQKVASREQKKRIRKDVSQRQQIGLSKKGKPIYGDYIISDSALDEIIKKGKSTRLK